MLEVAMEPILHLSLLMNSFLYHYVNNRLFLFFNKFFLYNNKY